MNNFLYLQGTLVSSFYGGKILEDLSAISARLLNSNCLRAEFS